LPKSAYEMSRVAQLSPSETKIINSTIDLRDTLVIEEMKPKQELFMISENEKIDIEMIDRIGRSGFSKIPIYKGYDKDHIVGILKTKILIFNS